MGSKADQIDGAMVVETLRKRPRLLFDVGRRITEMKIAGPWIGPVLVERPTVPIRGKTYVIHVEEYRREDILGRTVAMVMRVDNSKDDPSMPGSGRPREIEWFSCPRQVDAFDAADRKIGSFHHKGAEASVAMAKGQADMALIGKNYDLVNGSAFVAGSWEEKKNHHCRNIDVSVTARPEGSHCKIALVREKDGEWAWAILAPDDPDKALKWGTEKSSLRAKGAADKALRAMGWSLR
jgi:hypothetical protein